MRNNNSGDRNFDERNQVPVRAYISEQGVVETLLSVKTHKEGRNRNECSLYYLFPSKQACVVDITDGFGLESKTCGPRETDSSLPSIRHLLHSTALLLHQPPSFLLLKMSLALDRNSSPTTRIWVAVGTYEGVLAGWEMDYYRSGNDDADSSFANKKRRRGHKTEGLHPPNKFQLVLASPVHNGSARSVIMAGNGTSNASKDELLVNAPNLVVSTGYDEVVRTHDFSKHQTDIGELRTPSDSGTPTCSAFAPPPSHATIAAEASTSCTHCLFGFMSGDILVYKRKNWQCEHIMRGHEGGVASLAVHPTGKLALSGGLRDGKLKLWDLTRGRLAHVSKIKKQDNASRFNTIQSIAWNGAGTAYAFCHGSHLTVRDVESGSDLLDVELPSILNQLCFLADESRGLFVSVACNDGSLPVLLVPLAEDADSEERHAIMAIEPVDRLVAGEERFKCIHAVSDCLVVTANSAGVVSLMDLGGAVKMILQDKERTSIEDTTEDEDEIVDDDKDMAVKILDGTQLGTGARITSLSVWFCGFGPEVSDQQDDESDANRHRTKRVAVDEKKLAKARDLVAQAKVIQEQSDRERENDIRKKKNRKRRT